MWKLPLMFFTYQCIKLRQGAIKWASFGAGFFLLLGADIALSIFMLDIYNGYMYFGLYSLVTIGLALLNNAGLDRAK
jgi:hypothetical protein